MFGSCFRMLAVILVSDFCLHKFESIQKHGEGLGCSGKLDACTPSASLVHIYRERYVYAHVFWIPHASFKGCIVSFTCTLDQIHLLQEEDGSTPGGSPIQTQPAASSGPIPMPSTEPATEENADETTTLKTDPKARYGADGDGTLPPADES